MIRRRCVPGDLESDTDELPPAPSSPPGSHRLHQLEQQVASGRLSVEGLADLLQKQQEEMDRLRSLIASSQLPQQQQQQVPAMKEVLQQAAEVPPPRSNNRWNQLAAADATTTSNTAAERTSFKVEVDPVVVEPQKEEVPPQKEEVPPQKEEVQVSVLFPRKHLPRELLDRGGGSISATVPASSSASEVLLLLRRAVAENTGVQFRRIAMSLRGKVVQHEVDLPPPHSLTAAEAASLLGGGELRVVVLEGEGGGLG